MNTKKIILWLINIVWIRLLIVLTISLILVLSTSKLYPAKVVKNDASIQTFTTHLDGRIPALMKAYDIPGTNIALVKEGKTIWTKAYGYADLETGRKMTTDTYLRVQSISKSVTAWGVMNR